MELLRPNEVIQRNNNANNNENQQNNNNNNQNNNPNNIPNNIPNNNQNHNHNERAYNIRLNRKKGNIFSKSRHVYKVHMKNEKLMDG